MNKKITQSARRRGLYLLREIARTDPISITNILTLDAHKATAALDSPAVRLRAALAFLRLIETGRLSEILTGNFTDALNTALTENEACLPNAKIGMNNALFLGRSALLEEIVGTSNNSLLVNQPEDIEEAVKCGLETLSSIWPLEATAIRLCTDMFAGIDAPRGEIRCFSNVHLPGFMAIAINTPHALLAEQLVHESTHIRLSLLLEEDGHLGDTIANLPACYSPFTNLVRSAERVLHGVISYARVLLWWEALSDTPNLEPNWLDCSTSKEAHAIIEKRINTLRDRIRLGWMSLVRCARNTELSVLIEIFELMVGSKPPEFQANGNINNPATMLDQIQRAEFLLAVHGIKSSRFGCLTSDANLFEALLDSGVFFVISSRAFLPVSDDSLCGFSNTFGKACDIMQASDKHEVLCYVANTVELARIAAERDANDVAGDLFGIPTCCQSFFRANWATVNRKTGDLFGLLLERETSPVDIKIPWQCNSAAMYFGGGLCWHFPCSLECEATIKLVDKRQDDLRKIDLNLADDLATLQKKAFSWSHENGYKSHTTGDSVKFIRPI